MFDMPPAPAPQEAEKPPCCIVHMVEESHFADCDCNLHVMPDVATDEDLLSCAKELQQTFADGFQWEDLLTMVHLSFEFTDDFLDMTQKQKRDSVIKIIDYFIDITDTPYLPDHITDPVFKAVVPAFVDLTFRAFNKEFGVKSKERCQEKIGEPTQKEMDAFLAELSPLLEGDFSWENVMEVMSEGFVYCQRWVDLNQDQLKDVMNTVLTFIVETTYWPYGLDTVFDPLTKALLPPLIEYVFTFQEGCAFEGQDPRDFCPVF